ncbi:RNA-dependent RNA polymerase [Beihai narna-like virus 14]|uniref:RNA-dependent RNA polymerase n=1 Tax=Beihai narna-like virus 14 TaxID=1922441 RepID=UPI00090ADFD8|nr:RNA-dependent RNA polymerase [Beihai narna-like virus 14]APG77000.1 RNA-dependent RNA polymerase [Beihai narna-like virus 14]
MTTAIPTDQLSKAFKISLATFFSKENGQEMPEGYKSAFRLFPNRFYPLLRKRWTKKARRRTRETFMLLKAKRLSAPVPREMIRKAYESHGSLLSTVGKTPEDVLLTLRLVAREWAERVRHHYDETIPLGPSKAYFGCPRSSGGCFSSLKNLYSRLNTRGNPLMVGTRVDPPLIYLFGRPGVGKSFICNSIVRSLSECFGEGPASVYWRNYTTEHHDGYTGQLIYGIDDAFQNRDSVSAPDSVRDEIIQLRSNNPFTMKMARLEDKGRNFNSEFLLLSSNLSPEQVVACTDHIHCSAALGRRMKTSFEIKDFNHKTRLYRITVNELVNLEGRSPRLEQRRYLELDLRSLVALIVRWAVDEHRDAITHALASTGRERGWRIPMINYGPGRPCLGYEFPSELPEKNQVEAYAISEPLKVRLITKEQPLSYAMKPLQRAMTRALRDFNCFFPGWKGTLEDFVNLNLAGQKGHILSGDYSAATDNLNSDVMNTVLEEVKKVFPGHHLLHKYVDFFGGPHEVLYPKWTKLPAIQQRRGQLMGSLLSFPVLCIANAATLCHVRQQDLHELKACINGDDILFVDTNRCIRRWKKVATSLGLVPSIGKNFQDMSFGTINSELLFRRKKGNTFRSADTGKPGLLVRKNMPLAHLALKEGYSKGQVVLWGKPSLERHPGSIDVPLNFGGLGVEFDPSRRPTRKDRSLYLFHADRLLRHIRQVSRVEMTPGRSLVCLPRALAKGPLRSLCEDARQQVADFRLVAQSVMDTLLTEQEAEFPWREFHLFRRSAWEKCKRWRDFLASGSLETCQPLTALTPHWTTVSTEDLPFIDNYTSRWTTSQLFSRETRRTPCPV